MRILVRLAVILALLGVVIAGSAAAAHPAGSAPAGVAAAGAAWGTGLTDWWHRHGDTVTEVLTCGYTGLQIGMMLGGMGGSAVGLVIAGLACLK